MRGGFKHLDTGNSDFKQIYLPNFTQCLHRERAKKKRREKRRKLGKREGVKRGGISNQTHSFTH